jgi:pectate lyase
VPSDDHVYTRVDALEPLALLSLEAALRGQPELVPVYTGGTANFTCPYDGVGRRQENDLIYARRR